MLSLSMGLLGLSTMRAKRSGLPLGILALAARHGIADTLAGRRRIDGQSITVHVTADEFQIVWTSAQPIFIEGIWQ